MIHAASRTLTTLSLAASPGDGLTIAGVPFEFVLFALTLLGVALFHHHTLQVALDRLAAITRLQARLHRLPVRRGARRASPRTSGTSG